ncbi:MAG: chemotaxis protein CheA [Bacteroidetes bacterium]|nr:chemotaxis protein CheA [Bacteroidota bacterium]
MIDYLHSKFLEESGDLLNDLENSLLELENHPENEATVNRIFRALHTLKGSGAMFGYEVVSDFTHDLETLYDEVRNKKIRVNQEILDVTLQAVDLLRNIIFDPSADTDSIKNKLDLLGTRAVAIIETTLGSGSVVRYKSTKAEENKEPGNNELKTFKISFKPYPDILKHGNNPLYLVDELFLLGDCKVKSFLEGLPPLENLEVHICYVRWEASLTTTSDISDVRDVFLFVEDQSDIQIEEVPVETEPEELNQPDQNQQVEAVVSPKATFASTIRVSSSKLDQLMNLVSELVTMQARLDMVSQQTADPEIEGLAESLQKLSRQLRDITFEISMIPLQSIVTRFQRLVRDLSQELGKEIAFVTEGTETELDKTVIELVTDPLLHLLRNSIDHGIELPEKRLAKGKPTLGNIKLRAYHSGPNVCIEVIDDGAGISQQKVVSRAVERGLVQPGQALTEKEIFNLLFLPGFSTAGSVSTVSGRGVGLDVVKQNINEIRGEIQVSSEEGKGSIFTLRVPLTLSIIDGLLVSVGVERFIIPLDLVEKIVVFSHQELVDSFHNLIGIGDNKLPFYYLREEFNIQGEELELEQFIIVNYKGQQVGLAVDHVIGEYQIVIKPLGKIFARNRMFSGATILGDGEVALVLDTHRLISDLSDYQSII